MARQNLRCSDERATSHLTHEVVPGATLPILPRSADMFDNPAFRKMIVLSRDGTLECRLDDFTKVVMERGDKFPFSK
jgi:hypothetical protein